MFGLGKYKTILYGVQKWIDIDLLKMKIRLNWLEPIMIYIGRSLGANAGGSMVITFCNVWNKM
jgi:hypothetical protein